jgi:hypothetical protein
MKTTTTRTANRNTAARSLLHSAVAELVGDRHVDGALLALSRRWDAARSVATAAARRARVLALHALLLALAGRAVACRSGHRHAARGLSLALSLLSGGYALVRRHYPAARSAALTAATVGGERAAFAVALGLATAARLWGRADLDRVNGLVADALERAAHAARWLWDAARRQPARLASPASPPLRRRRAGGRPAACRGRLLPGLGRGGLSGPPARSVGLKQPAPRRTADRTLGRRDAAPVQGTELDSGPRQGPPLACTPPGCGSPPENAVALRPAAGK